MTLEPALTQVRERIMAASKPDSDGCWIWQQATDRGGYGRIHVKTIATRAAHRVSYEAFRGPIPEGLTIDHACFKPACVNPDHLRPMSRSENARRQRSALSPCCKNGHELTPENLARPNRGRRMCRICFNAWQRAHRERQRSAS